MSAENAFRPGLSYTVQVSFARVTRSQQKGTPGLQLTFIHEDGQSMIDHTVYITDKTMPHVKKMLEDVFDLTEDQIQSQNFWKNIDSQLSGKMCNISIIEEPYNGKMYKKVQYINPAGASFEDMPEPADQIARMFGGREYDQVNVEARIQKAATSAAPPKTEDLVPEGSDDDLPF